MTSKNNRGFTLIELMVALTAALFFSIFVFMMTRDASRFFEKEARLADATLTNINGFRRLSADIARAGFLASPNLSKDPHRCPEPAVSGSIGSMIKGDPTWDSYKLLANMGLIRIKVGDAAATATGTRKAMLDGNSLNPDSIVLYGAYTMNEPFSVKTIAGAVITLDLLSGSMRRAGWKAMPDAAKPAFMAAMFPPDRALRITNQLGEEQYVIIGSTTATATEATITAKNGAMQPVLQANNPACGIRGLGADTFVNTVNIIKYSLKDMSGDDNLKYLFEGARHPSDVATRLDLVRTELNPQSADDTTEFAGTSEIVAENVVDLKATLEVVTNILLNQVSTVTDETKLGFFASTPTSGDSAGSGFGPHLIRGVHIRMSTRTAAPDREAASFGSDVGAGLYRVALDFSGTEPKDYARVRSLETTIATRNARNSLW